MRDGVGLSTDIWLPAAEGSFPAILLRTPYQKAPQFSRYKLEYFVRHGYAVVLQDVRGRGDSDGEFHFYFGEGEDGYDTIEWIAQQPWSNGDVGMSGGSYLGTVQWLAARERPPHLRCIIPTASSGRLFDELPYLGGAFRMGWALQWLNDVSARASQGPSAAALDWEAISAHRPLLTMNEFMGRRIPLWKEFLEHPTLDDYWAPLDFGREDFRKIDFPVLTVTRGFMAADQHGDHLVAELLIGVGIARAAIGRRQERREEVIGRIVLPTMSSNHIKAELVDHALVLGEVGIASGREARRRA